MKILFLGQNPAEASPKLAFVGTKSGKTLDQWIFQSSIPVDQPIVFANVFDFPTISNKPLKASDITSAAKSSFFLEKIEGCDIVFSCGKQASKAVAIAMAHFGLQSIKAVSLPHPSGLNRKLNDKAFVNQTIKLISETYESVLLEKMERHK